MLGIIAVSLFLGFILIFLLKRSSAPIEADIRVLVLFGASNATLILRHVFEHDAG